MFKYKKIKLERQLNTEFITKDEIFDENVLEQQSIQNEDSQTIMGSYNLNSSHQFEKTIADQCNLNLLELIEEEESDAEDEISDHNTGTEQSDLDNSDDDGGVEDENRKKYNFLLGKDKETKWGLNPPNKTIETTKENINTYLPGVNGPAKQVKNIVGIWKLFFPLSTVQEIVTFTNAYLEKLKLEAKYKRDVRTTNVNEIYALIGLLYLIGLKHGSHFTLKELWCSDGTAPDIFRSVMSLQRFNLLLRALRFDDFNSREERKAFDNLAPIRKFSDDFIDRCQNLYTPGKFLTIDEMLESFRGRCKFRQYIANKPAKYGIKIYSLVDSKTFYTVKMEIYGGKQPDGPYKKSNSAFDLVKRLSSPILNTGRNITMDNYFTSVPLAQDLLKNHKTTIVGTISKNERELPPEFLVTRKRPVASSQFAFTDNCTLVSYVPKKNKNVLVLSTLHYSNQIDANSGEKMKPEMITFYNSTKGGVDTVDELKGIYTTARETKRWPMVIFYSFLNISGINAQIIYKDNNLTNQNLNPNLTRREFLKTLSLELIQPHLLDRLKETRLTMELRQTIMKITKLKTGVVPEEDVITPCSDETGKDGFCSYCPRRKNRKTKKKCRQCSLPVCNEHVAFLCMKCETKMIDNFTEC
ncbi:piggyBac transposable element-derived protein 4-like [Chrysoperla carnea]|uniref:piggyBac transposable element-derived protein 4-like n=1 Tax=Chrysoperla carnea TaxID=189513 RepID=UPI001D074589|nr:piggyBac transposable element-derived protein 4-like [Chrysoperla carnea]